jgi:HopA1 effector protein family
MSPPAKYFIKLAYEFHMPITSTNSNLFLQVQLPAEGYSNFSPANQPPVTETNMVHSSSISPEEGKTQAQRDKVRFARMVAPIQDVKSAKSTAAATYARESLLAWAEQTCIKIIQIFGIDAFKNLPHNEEGELQDRQFHIKKLTPIAYDLFADGQENHDARTLSRQEQEQFVERLARLSKQGKCIIQAQGKNEDDPIDGLSPQEAFAQNSNEAKFSHFKVLPCDIKERMLRSADGSCARKILNVSLADGIKNLVDLNEQLVPLLYAFKDITTHFKSIAPTEQGSRPENIILYLNQANYERAKELDTAITALLASEQWKPRKPWGMYTEEGAHPYAEFSKHAVSTSYAEDRADMLINASIDHLVYGIELKDALHAILVDRGYSPDNPAYIDRS